MNLGQVLQNIPMPPGCSGDLDITGLTVDSRTVKPGDLFFGLRGRNCDGKDYAAAAIDRGATAAVVPVGSGLQGPYIEVPDVLETLAAASANFHGHPAGRLQLIGVTGTNGKTTTTHLARRILEEAGLSCGMIGTVYHIVGGRKVPSGNTTPLAPELHELLARMADAGDTHVVMEVSSHGLTLKRVHGLGFAAGAFTNLTHEHLDFHGDFEAYLAAKGTLLKHSRVSVINMDDPAFERLSAMAGGSILSYSLEQSADLQGMHCERVSRGERFILQAGGESVSVELPFPGRYNVSNALAAAGVAKAVGIPLPVISRGLEKADPVPGRMEFVDMGQPFRAIVDYAHTPDGLTKALSAVREVTPGRIISVFGGRGERDRLKRPVMGRIAGTMADIVVVTTDCPYGEDPGGIAVQVAEGLDEVNASYFVVPDRGQAIREACRMARSGDTVIVTGRGHESHQHFPDRDVPFDDRDVMRKALREQMIREPAQYLEPPSSHVPAG